MADYLEASVCQRGRRSSTTRALTLPALLALAGCQTTQPGIEVREVQVPTPVPCVNEADIPAEPPQVGDQFNGDAKHDLGILAPNALELRSWGRTLRALIVPGCTVVSR